MARILVVDDEALVRAMVREAGADLGHEVLEAGTLSQGLALAASGVDLVLLDVMLPDGDGLAHVPVFAMLPRQPEIMVVTGFGHADGLAAALHSGAMEYLVKPLKLRPLQQSLQQALAWREDKRGRNETLVRQGIVGKSRALHEALAQLSHAASSNMSVLILGETGVGKEVFARTLHAGSLRKRQPLITVDCASLPENLLESQLFGHAKGAFTGADRSQEGLLRAADGGTLFLDEVGELPISLQSSFLRALDVHCFRPIGEKEEVSSDFRVVAATNKNLQEMAREKTFRNDLLFRLQGITIVVPPLRERKEDILELGEYFLARHAEKLEQPKVIGPDLGDALQSYNWPGNVRELAHVMERACVLSGHSETLHTIHLPVEMRISLSRNNMDSQYHPKENFTLSTLKVHKNQAEEDYLRNLMTSCKSDMGHAAHVAGISRGHLYELLKKHNL